LCGRNVAFEALTPSQTGHEADVLCAPQNPSYCAQMKRAVVEAQSTTTTLLLVAVPLQQQIASGTIPTWAPSW
jgi:hypothetical protein